MKWLLAGSISLDTIAARLGWGDTINDLEPFPLAASRQSHRAVLPGPTGHQLSPTLEESARQAIVKRVGWRFYLQIMFSQLREDWGGQRCQTGHEAAVEYAFERLLDPRLPHAFRLLATTSR